MNLSVRAGERPSDLPVARPQARRPTGHTRTPAGGGRSEPSERAGARSAAQYPARSSEHRASWMTHPPPARLRHHAAVRPRASGRCMNSAGESPRPAGWGGPEVRDPALPDAAAGPFTGRARARVRHRRRGRKASGACRGLTRVWSGHTSFGGCREAGRCPEGRGGASRILAGAPPAGSLHPAAALRRGSSLPESPGRGDHQTGTQPQKDTRTRRMMLSAPAPPRSRRRNPGCSAA